MLDLNRLKIKDIVPHSGAMVLLDRILSVDDQSLSAEFVVRGDGLLGSERTVPAWAGIEYMAQAIAAHVGIMAKLRGEAIKMGYLLGTRRYSCNAAEFRVGSTFKVEVARILQDDQLAVFDCRIRGCGVEVNAMLNVYQPHSNEITFNK
ncbi:MAG: ApeP family dehydratase [Gammaproteobacteria bacterium]